MALTVKFTYHLIVFLIDAFAVYYDYFEIDLGHSGFGGKFKFLTLWCIILQTAYFGVAVLVDLTERVKFPTNASQRNGLQEFRDFFHTTIAFPIAAFVAVTFWALYAIDRELVYPKIVDKIIPVWLNHVLHTTILPMIVLDKLLVRHFYPRRLYGILAASGLAIVYLFWILLIAYIDNFWVYPVLKVLKVHERAIFITACVAVFSAFYLLGESVTNYIWGVPHRTSRVHKTPKRKH